MPYPLDGIEPRPTEGHHVEGAEEPLQPKGALPEVERKEEIINTVRILAARGELWRLVG